MNYWGEKSSSALTWTLPDGITVAHHRGQSPATARSAASSATPTARCRSGTAAGRTATTSLAVDLASVMFSVVLDPGVDLTETNEPPTAEFTSGCAGLTCEFDADHSFDPDDDTLTYAWNFGDGQTGTGVNPAHTYASAGTRTVTLTVDDGHGHTDQATGTRHRDARPTRRPATPGWCPTHRAPTSR